MKKIFNDKCLCFEEIESKILLQQKLLECQYGYLLCEGYENKKNYLIQYFDNNEIKCYGIGISCQSDLNFDKNVIILESENLIVLYYDNILEIYSISANVANKIFEYSAVCYIYSINIIFHKLIVVYEIGVLIIDLKKRQIVNEVSTDIIQEFYVSNDYIYIKDMQDKKYYLRI